MYEKLLNSDFFKDGSMLRIGFTTALRKNSRHSNEFWEILYIYEGHGLLDNGKENINVKTGDVIIIKPSALYSITSPPDKHDVLARLCRFIFTQDYFDAIAYQYKKIFSSCGYELYEWVLDKNGGCIHMPDDDAQNIHNIMWLAAHEYNHFKIGSREIIDSSMLNLFISITRLYEAQKNHVPPTVSTNRSLEEVKKYISSNFAYDITLDFLASMVHLSKEHLSRAFKHYTGKTISDYILEVRMTRVKQMLRNPSLSVTEISNYCGYRTIGNFQRAFRKYTGMTATEYRQKLKLPS